MSDQPPPAMPPDPGLLERVEALARELLAVERARPARPSTSPIGGPHPYADEPWFDAAALARGALERLLDAAAPDSSRGR